VLNINSSLIFYILKLLQQNWKSLFQCKFLHKNVTRFFINRFSRINNAFFESTNNTTKYILFRGNFISKFDTMSKVSWKDITFYQIVPKWTYVNKLLIYSLCTLIKLPIEEIFYRDSNKTRTTAFKRNNYIYWYSSDIDYVKISFSCRELLELFTRNIFLLACHFFPSKDNF